MKLLKRNQRQFYYAPYQGDALLVDTHGFDTGEYGKTYGNPVKARGTITPATGEVNAQQFGGDLNYDKVILSDNPDFPIDEYSLLWVDTMPVIKANGKTDTPHDYVVKRVSRNLNVSVFAISKVKVNAD